MTLNLRKIILASSFLILILVTVLMYQNTLSKARVEKRDLEIARILKKDLTQKICVQYALIATRAGEYPCFNCGTANTIFLNIGEVWKYGKTCNGEDGRYPSGMPFVDLAYRQQFVGNEEECLIIEKQKIYDYYYLPENIKRASANGTEPLVRPPGNKIDR